ncbi:MAG: SDR family oxidoreductase [Pirellulales bacterium]|nr:SDR family oxidoreductase [Pirellulales bacterium]
MPMRLKEKSIIVTGSTTGIGKAIAIRCASEGARVVVHGLEDHLATQVVAEIGAERAVAHVEDLTIEGCPSRLVALAVEKFGRLDAVVNNAALVATGTIENTDAAYFMKMISINTLAPYLMIQAALPHLRDSRGSVVNIGSVNAYAGEPDLLPYSVSKGALMTLTRNLGDVLMREDRVRVNQINPGWVLTENEAQRKREHGLHDTWYEDLPAEYAPSGRIMLPDEIAAAAVYFLSDECGPVSAQVLDCEQYPYIGRNPPKDTSTIPPS